MSADDIEVSPGLWVHCDVRGPEADVPLVVLPPLGGSGDLFAPFRDHLAAAARVVTCEPPGSGDAAAPRGVPSTRSLARDVIAALDALAIDRADLFGVSLGGMIAQWIAIRAPQRIRRLVLASTTARGLAGFASSPAQKLALARCLLLPEPGVELAEAIVSDATLDDPKEKARIEAALRAHPRPRSDLLWLAGAAATHDTSAELEKILAPTLVLTGGGDTLVPRDAQESLAHAIPEATQVTIDHAGHDVTLDQPALTASVVLEFLTR